MFLRTRIPPFRRRDLPGLYLAALLFGLVAPLLPAPVPAAVPVPGLGVVPAPAAAPPPVRVQVVAAGPVVPRAQVLDRLADARTVALTFDDGPDPTFTPRVLDVLQRYGAVATFCMVGRPAAAQPALVRRVVDAGMRLCDHGRTHDEQLPGRPRPTVDDEVLGAATTLSAVAGGAPVQWYRAPGGNWSPEITTLAATNGLQPLGWNVDPKDWERPGVDAIVAAVQRQLREQAPAGAVVLLHDGGGAREQTVAAVEQLVPWLAGQGYRFGFPTG